MVVTTFGGDVRKHSAVHLFFFMEPWGMDGRAMGIPKTEIVLKRTQNMFIWDMMPTCAHTHIAYSVLIYVYMCMSNIPICVGNV